MRNGLQELFDNHGEVNAIAKRHMELAARMVCPFMPGRQVTLHNKRNGYNTVPVGVNRIADNDVVISDESMCLGPGCMAYDIETKTCKRCHE